MAYADKALTAKDLVYEVTGKRLLSVSTEAANRIISCSYAYRLTGEDKYLEKAEKDMQTVCAFKDWNSATHFLDGAEMAHGVGIGYDWLYGRLSDATKKSAEKAIRDYAFYCALNGKWNLNFYTSATNWNQVCNGGLVVAALAVYETCQDDARSIIDKAIESNASVMPRCTTPTATTPKATATGVTERPSSASCSRRWSRARGPTTVFRPSTVSKRPANGFSSWRV